MFRLVEITLLVLGLGLLIPTVMLLIECVAALLPSSQTGSNAAPQVQQPSLAILIPAHNEALGILATLETLLPQVVSPDQLIVIADNCNDCTASIARSVGATVLERQDTKLRGKGYALDFGMRYLASNPPDVVIIVDADCYAHPGMVQQLASTAVQQQRPVQATNLLTPPAEASLKDAISAFAFTVKNLVRPQGLRNLQLPCLLSTGTAFPWSVINQMALASGNLVEDMQLAIDLAIVGYPPVFCAEAKVTGSLPQQNQAAKTQRTRWEQGHLQTLFTQVPKLLKAAIAQRQGRLVMMALDLAIPPLSFLVMLWILIMSASLVVGGLWSIWMPACLMILIGQLLLISIGSAWAKFGRADLPAQALLAIPLYLLWKVPLYLKFFASPQKQWIRTARDPIKVL
jgi:cellulose synthase/poly-beta-1,6-N-acetylglucosamine synthase-like glycosyltransferase